MNVVVNGEVEAVIGISILDLLLAKGIDPAARGTAVALNDAVLPRARWPERQLAAGDRVEIVRPFQGG
ncbi:MULTISPECIES: sulfur carrier protein ThiS [Inquilinus]|uniref:Sulfur carrier protein n=1 Tax=Inquilinus ginsengisoli TaxID=363840 RepID=A0ABU1K029_9PROT|nr:sulfur carrier protein ThiS [Inquilinus ginsengisoli]MDR6294212.1 sulfur carrier protein [Inquilinus ginsengisoli]